jgi:hypothetical protein
LIKINEKPISHDRFFRHLINKRSDVKKLVRVMLQSPGVFAAIYNALICPKFVFHSGDNRGLSIVSHDKLIADAIRRDGCYVIRGLYSSNDLMPLCTFDENVRRIIGNDVRHSGFLSMDGQQLNRKVFPNFGNCRSQSKTIDMFHPSSHALFSRVHGIFKEYYHNDACYLHRTTFDWMSNAPINHNGWHFDTIRPQLKAFILVEDVNESLGPFCVAQGSAGCNTEFE